jgi:hypothetical protein
MIPMEYESRRHCVTVLGWQDPRGLDDDGEPLLEHGVSSDGQAAQILEEREGALMWPERFGPNEIVRIKNELGPYITHDNCACGEGNPNASRSQLRYRALRVRVRPTP